MKKLIPQLLRPGDEIRITAPASGVKIISRLSGTGAAALEKNGTESQLRRQRRRRKKLGCRRFDHG